MSVNKVPFFFEAKKVLLDNVINSHNVPTSSRKKKNLRWMKKSEHSYIYFLKGSFRREKTNLTWSFMHYVFRNDLTTTPCMTKFRLYHTNI